MVVLRGEGGVRHFFSMFSLFYREFYTESSGFYLISKFQAVFEISRQTRKEKSPFWGLNLLKIDLKTLITWAVVVQMGSNLIYELLGVVFQ